MKRWFSNFMMGRYGSDEYGRFLGILSCILLVVSLIVSTASTAGIILWAVALILIIYSYFRMFSKKVNKRFAENYKFLHIKNKILSPFKKKISRMIGMSFRKYGILKLSKRKMTGYWTRYNS